MTSAHTTETPSLGNIDNGAPLTRGVKYTFDTDGVVSSVTFWVPSTNTGTYTVGFFAVTQNDDDGGTGDLLASASVAAGTVTADTWAEVPIATQAVLANHTYAAAVHASSGRYVATPGALFAAGISNGGVNAIQSGSDPNANPGGTMRNGTFFESASLAYPATIGGQPDFFVDVNYTAGTPTEATLDAVAAPATADLAASSTAAATLAEAATPAVAALAAASHSDSTLAETATAATVAAAGASSADTTLAVSPLAATAVAAATAQTSAQLAETAPAGVVSINAVGTGRTAQAVHLSGPQRATHLSGPQHAKHYH